MDFNQFKIMYAETMMYYQVIEHDVKYIYAHMLEGNDIANLKLVEKKTLGQMIDILQDLDYSDNNPLISKNDYDYLRKITKNRNHWAHKVFIEFVYIKNYINSKEYENEYMKLKDDYGIAKRVYKILEDIRVEYYKNN